MAVIPRLSASMSSTHGQSLGNHLTSAHDDREGFDARFCIDDDPNTFCHTRVEGTEGTTGTGTYPWLSIQIPGSTFHPLDIVVSHVVILNRHDCCRDRLSPFQIWVGQAAGDYNSSTSNECGTFGWGKHDDLSVPNSVGPFTFDCHGLVGWYVTIVLPGVNRILNLGEVRLYSDFHSPSHPPPPPPVGAEDGLALSEAILRREEAE